MAKIIYKPKSAGKSIVGKRGNRKVIRKFHLTKGEFLESKKVWLENLTAEERVMKKRAGKLFFNPYRKGIYYYEVQALFSLGPNVWHSFPIFLQKLEEIMSRVPAKMGRFTNSWEEFKGKAERNNAYRCRDFMGRIQENMIILQRLSKLNPYGYKLRQVGAAIDIKRISKEGFPNGIYYYRLSTYNCPEKAAPIRDFRGFIFPRNEKKYISHKFIGKVITRKSVIDSGEEKKRSCRVSK